MLKHDSCCFLLSFYYHASIMLFTCKFIYMSDNMLFMFDGQKIAIGKKDAKTGHKSASDMADKHPCIPGKAPYRPGSVPLPHPGLGGRYTRISSGSASCF